MIDPLKPSLENLYSIFSKYSLGDFSNVTCFDSGPSEKQLAGISGDLRSIPDDVVGGMGFFGAGWETWGTRDEVKYFLPRLLHYLAEDVGRLELPGLYSLFKYKLANCLHTRNGEWSEDEREAIRIFFEKLLETHGAALKELGLLVECVLEIGMKPEKIRMSWKANDSMHQDRLSRLFEHFGCPLAGYTNKADFRALVDSGQPEGAYLKDSQTIKNFLHTLIDSLP